MRIDTSKLEKEISQSNQTVSKIAEKGGICKATLYAVIGGKSCTKASAVCIASGLGVPLEALLPDKEV